jgi:hypothetical protein
MGKQLASQSADPINQMQKTVTSTNTSLLDVQKSISSQVDDAAKNLGDAATKIGDFKTSFDSANDAMKTYDGYRNLAVLVILILPCLSFVSIVFGGLFKAGCPFTLYVDVSSLGSCLLLFGQSICCFCFSFVPVTTPSATSSLSSSSCCLPSTCRLLLFCLTLVLTSTLLIPTSPTSVI